MINLNRQTKISLRAYKKVMLAKGYTPMIQSTTIDFRKRGGTYEITFVENKTFISTIAISNYKTLGDINGN